MASSAATTKASPRYIHGYVARPIGSDWIGLQRIYDGVLALSLVIFFYAVGIFIFRLGGVWSAALYKKAAHAQAKTITPAQTHA
jgi:hypothetical protein